MLQLNDEVLYVATGNKGKLAEFVRSASNAGVTVLPLPGLAEMPEPVEDSTTFMGNAELKAIACSLAAPGIMVMADDSGLAVEELAGDPGVRSARYADDQGFEMNAEAGKDDRNNRCLLQRMEGVANRAARFVCTLAVAQDGKVIHRAHGEVAGELLTAPRGADGFGYDPLFLVPSLGKTMAELTKEAKWEISHRGNAFRALLQELKKA